MKCRACFNCRQYITIQNDYASQLRDTGFTQHHIGHPIGITDHTELTGYMNVNFVYSRQRQMNPAEKVHTSEGSSEHIA